MTIKDQPPPKPNDGPAAWDLVVADIEDIAKRTDHEHQFLTGSMGVRLKNIIVADIRERDRIGEERYGVRLQPNNGRDAMVDAYQESLDAVVYLRQAHEEMGVHKSGEPICRAYTAAIELMLRVRVALLVREEEAGH